MVDYSKFEGHNGVHTGKLDPQWRNYQYLTAIANAAIAKYPEMRITSGQRDGDIYHHGQHQAIDIAFPPSMNGSAKYKEVADWVFETFPTQVAYVITLGQVRDRNGYSGTGNSGKWVRWADNDHYDHLHISGNLGSAHIIKGVKTMPLNGIDISSWQGNIDVSKVPADFVIIKATGGKGYVNPYCDSRFQLAKKSGKLLGVYHYAHELGLQGSAVEEADYFLKHASGYLKGDAIPILDWESDNKTDVQWALTWLKRVEEKTGIKPWFYTYTSVLQSANFKPIGDAGYGLWIANYGTDARINGYKQPNPPVSKGFELTACFQYSSNTYLSNYTGRLDANVFYGDSKAWKAYATPKGKQPVAESKPAPKPVEKTIDQLAKEVLAGKHGNGDARKKSLGSKYAAVQKKVEQLLAKKSIATIAKEVIAGKWGNGTQRTQRLKAAGYDASKVQAEVNKQLTPKKSVDAVAREIINGTGGWGNDPQRSQKLKAAGYDPATVQKRVNQLI